ncbi:hypothetical protein AB4Z52_30860 [Rhizobium sp. 2YAF20]|uniref:hypothetical protein n=1 Tax=Rhizobium sp. 2YAF20 TaxID=3233027 RepID=UPI003F967E72
MSDEPTADSDTQHHWKEQSMTTATITLDQVKKRERQFTRTTNRRNTLEYLTGGSAALFLLFMAVFTFITGDSAIDMLIASGFAALVTGMVCVGLHLFTKSRRIKGHKDMAATGIDHLTRRLEHERVQLRSAWLWYVGPMIPGFAMIYGGMFLAGKVSFAFTADGLTFAFLLFVAVLNRRAAAKLEGEIEDLRRHLK